MNTCLFSLKLLYLWESWRNTSIGRSCFHFEAQQANYLNIMFISSVMYAHFQQCFHSVWSFHLSPITVRNRQGKIPLLSTLKFLGDVSLCSSLSLILLFAVHFLPQKWGQPWSKKYLTKFSHRLRTLSSSHAYFSC